MTHSCVSVPLDVLFARSTPTVRAAFDAFVALIERCGPVEVIGQKSRIVIMARVRFAGATGLPALVCEGYRDLGLQGSLAASRASDG